MYNVEVVSYETDEVVKSVGCNSINKAERIESGMIINLNVEEYFTRIIDEDGNEV